MNQARIISQDTVSSKMSCFTPKPVLQSFGIRILRKRDMRHMKPDLPGLFINF